MLPPLMALEIALQPQSHRQCWLQIAAAHPALCLCLRAGLRASAVEGTSETSIPMHKLHTSPAGLAAYAPGTEPAPASTSAPVPRVEEPPAVNEAPEELDGTPWAWQQKEQCLRL